MKTENKFLLAIFDDMMVNPDNYKNVTATQAIDNYHSFIWNQDLMDEDEKIVLLSDTYKISVSEMAEFEEELNQ